MNIYHISFIKNLRNKKMSKHTLAKYLYTKRSENSAGINRQYLYYHRSKDYIRVYKLKILLLKFWSFVENFERVVSCLKMY